MRTSEEVLASLPPYSGSLSEAARLVVDAPRWDWTVERIDIPMKSGQSKDAAQFVYLLRRDREEVRIAGVVSNTQGIRYVRGARRDATHSVPADLVEARRKIEAPPMTSPEVGRNALREDEVRYMTRPVQRELDSEIIFSIEEAPEGGYTAIALGYSIVTEADSLDELREMVREAVELYFEGSPSPGIIRLHLVRDELIAV